MLEQISLFILGGSGYLAVELAWRGTSHWTMFLAGGIVCAFCTGWRHGKFLCPRQPVQGLRASAGWKYASAFFAGNFCISACGITVRNGGMWPD